MEADASEPIGFVLRPSVIGSGFWGGERLPKKLRAAVLERDNHTCQGCGHRALKYMSVHHIREGDDHSLGNLITLCVACHAVMHIGRNLDLGTIEIWNSPLPQDQVVRGTREGVRRGYSLARIKKDLHLKPGPFAPASIEYGIHLTQNMGSLTRAYLEEPLCAIFVKFTRWQLE
jgi:hypothetical protein